jgi:hypothetical protein
MKILQIRADDDDEPSDAGEVEALYARAMDGWNRGSGIAFAAPFAEDADVVAFPSATKRADLRLAGSATLASGVVEMRYTGGH